MEDKKFYLTSENDYDDSYNEYLTDDIDDAIDTLLSYKKEEFASIKVFDKGKVVYLKTISLIDKPDRYSLKRNIENREDRFWNY